MKKLILALLIVIAFLTIGCYQANEADTTIWVKTAKKPIICKLAGRNTDGFVIYTLIDADGNIYSTGLVTFNLPDTLK
jgi:hypothetical protein